MFTIFRTDDLFAASIAEKIAGGNLSDSIAKFMERGIATAKKSNLINPLLNLNYFKPGTINHRINVMHLMREAYSAINIQILASFRRFLFLMFVFLPLVSKKFIIIFFMMISLFLWSVMYNVIEIIICIDHFLLGKTPTHQFLYGRPSNEIHAFLPQAKRRFK